MTDFEPIGLKHRPLFDRAHAAEPTFISGDSFGCVYLWDLICRRNIAWLDGRLGIEYQCSHGIIYAYPFGEGDLTAAVEALRDRAAFRGRTLELWGLTPPQRSALEEAFPGRFDYTDDRKNYDYICETEAVASLSGKKLHGKQNFCNRFEKAHAWSFVPISRENFDDCLSLQSEWTREKSDVNREEDLAIRRMFREWDELGMLGGILYADGAPAGFTAAERIAPDMADIHFEKARADIPGAYPMVAREFARMVAASMPEVRYLNREEDMDLPNLRRAKEEWHPAWLLRKFTARWRDET